MKKEKISKLIVVLIMGILLFVVSTNTFAVEGDPDSGLDLFGNNTSTNTNINTTSNTNTNTNDLKDLTGQLNTNTSTNTNTNTTNTNTNTNYNTNLPKAGVAENTMLGVTITVLAITAIYAYKKVKEYKNI